MKVTSGNTLIFLKAFRLNFQLIVNFMRQTLSWCSKLIPGKEILREKLKSIKHLSILLNLHPHTFVTHLIFDVYYFFVLLSKLTKKFAKKHFFQLFICDFVTSVQCVKEINSKLIFVFLVPWNNKSLDLLSNALIKNHQVLL
jgi:membrane associated rhomboid family serine protease